MRHFLAIGDPDRTVGDLFLSTGSLDLTICDLDRTIGTLDPRIGNLDDLGDSKRPCCEQDGFRFFLSPATTSDLRGQRSCTKQKRHPAALKRDRVAKSERSRSEVTT